MEFSLGETMNNLIRRILDISYRHKLSHLSSCLTSLPIVKEIYSLKKEDEVFILSNGHAGLALYVVLEEKYGVDAEAMLEKHGIHPGRDLENKIYCSTGSLGSGLPISIGHALADRQKDVYCLISDGESSEGSIWESLRFARANNISNLNVYANINGISATEFLDKQYLIDRLKAFYPNINIKETSVEDFEFLKGIIGHYRVMGKEDYEEALRVVSK